jgi:hypothetical protein
MTTMVLWLNTGTLADDVKLAEARFEERHETQANVIWFTPDRANKIKANKVNLGLEIRDDCYILPGYFGLSREDNVKGKTS